MGCDGAMGGLSRSGGGGCQRSGYRGLRSLLNRSIGGWLPHKVSAMQMDAYLNGLEWRFNNRLTAELLRDTVLGLLASGNIDYKGLTA